MRTGFFTRHPVQAYLLLTFTLSWSGFLLAGWRGLLAGTPWETDPSFLTAVTAMLAGPPVAGILMTVLVGRRAGLRDLLSRLLRWRVPARWYLFALLAAPLVELSVLVALSGFSDVFLPSIVVAESRKTLLLSGIGIGIVGGLAEELGWTGFAIPRLRRRQGVLTVGLFMGVVWTAWHLLQMWRVGSTSSQAVPLGFFMPLYVLAALAALTAYRILMVWAYDRTESLLIAVLMHASYIFATLFVLAPPTAGMPFLLYAGLFALALWAVVGVVGGRLAGGLRAE